MSATKRGNMALSGIEENDIKALVLFEVEKLLTLMSYKYKVNGNNEMISFY
jgi:hypothetical protein